ncbi:Uu.00g083190.m01.CDS01 [Anthostomella pinea]|uniref:Uu.00g083190.m01.CDS01 n=1 Tax=Anthostomella pinea TaxID=933095 RepID=A0AAI8VG44_9PEZI|nr:Uu.00g083190.m01.CDS01 [Anthostomella pinea]
MATNSSEVNPVFTLIIHHQNDTAALSPIIAPPWVNDLGFRGTSGILVSCVGTLLACVYTALHLDMPALVAPEMVLYVAAQQFIEARALVKELNEIQRRFTHSTDEDFTLEYTFFVLMGGLQVDVTQLLSDNVRRYQSYHARILIDDSIPEKLILSPRGLLELAKHGQFIRVPLATIVDKSKSDGLKKGLVVGQLVWMVTQCITRKVYGLPLCLLEVHTAVHAFCALYLYLFWLKVSHYAWPEPQAITLAEAQKPLDISDPEVIKPGPLEHLFGFMVQEQFYDLQNTQLMIYPAWTAASATWYPKTLSAQMSNPNVFTCQLDEKREPVPVEWVDEAWGPVTLEPGQALKCGIGLLQRDHSPDPDQTCEKSEPENATSALTPPAAGGDELEPQEVLVADYTDQTRWKAMLDFLFTMHGDTSTAPYLFHPTPGPRFPDRHYHDAFTLQTSNLPSLKSGLHTWDLVSSMSSHPLLQALLLTLPPLYGGIHLAACNFTFPTFGEQICWRVACMLIITAIPLVVVLKWCCFWGEQIVLRCGFWAKLGPRFFVRSQKAMRYAPLGAYALARLFIVAKSFASLRRVPIGVF